MTVFGSSSCRRHTSCVPIHSTLVSLHPSVGLCLPSVLSFHPRYRLTVFSSRLPRTDAMARDGDSVLALTNPMLTLPAMESDGCSADTWGINHAMHLFPNGFLIIKQSKINKAPFLYFLWVFLISFLQIRHSLFSDLLKALRSSVSPEN